MIIDVLTQETIKGNDFKLGKRIVKTKKIYMCQYCYMPSKEIIKCTGKDCGVDLCKSCITHINHKPFCNDCVADIVRNKTVIILTKGV